MGGNPGPVESSVQSRAALTLRQIRVINLMAPLQQRAHDRQTSSSSRSIQRSLPVDGVATMQGLVLGCICCYKTQSASRSIPIVGHGDGFMHVDGFQHVDNVILSALRSQVHWKLSQRILHFQISLRLPKQSDHIRRPRPGGEVCRSFVMRCRAVDVSTSTDQNLSDLHTVVFNCNMQQGLATGSHQIHGHETTVQHGLQAMVCAPVDERLSRHPKSNRLHIFSRHRSCR
mmetsp:Transcript_18467/g.39830  ORF Transcript_18467/g.39830 Transcript_18467/m.39830 type:complete len:230 (+) Transcript_18467:1500-2189(+)